MRSFARRRDGTLEARLSEPEVELLCAVARQMRELLQAEGAEPGLRRLFPPAYEDDPEAQGDYAHLTSDDLRAGKMRAIDAVLAVFEGRERRRALDGEQAQQLLGVLNDARLTLGTQLDVSEDMEAPGPPSGAEAARLEVYRYLGWLEEQLVETLDTHP